MENSYQALPHFLKRLKTAAYKHQEAWLKPPAAGFTGIGFIFQSLYPAVHCSPWSAVGKAGAVRGFIPVARAAAAIAASAFCGGCRSHPGQGSGVMV